LSASGVYVGTDETGKLLCLTNRSRAEHTYILGKSGTGKTFLLCNLVAQDLFFGNATVYFDLIGTGVPYLRNLLGAANLQALARERSPYPGLNARFRERRERAMGKITFLSFDGPDFAFRFNPLEPASWMSTAEQAEAFAACIERMLGGKLSEMRQLHLNLVALASILIETGGATVADLVELCCMGTDSFQEYLRILDKKRARGALGVPVRRDLVRLYLAEFFARTQGRERRDLMASTLRALAMLLSDSVAAKFLSSARGNLDLEAVMNQGHSLLISLPPHNLHTQTAISSLLLGRLIALAMRRDAQRVQRGELPQVSLVLDEFQTAFSEEMACEIAVMRNKGVQLTLAHQSSSQPPFHLPEGRAMLESIRDNCSTSILLRMGHRDAEDLAPGCFEPDGKMLKMRRREHSRSQGQTRSDTQSRSSQSSVSQTRSQGTSRSEGSSQARAQSRSSSRSTGRQRSHSRGSSVAQSQGESQAITQSRSVGSNRGTNAGLSQSQGGTQSQSHSRSRGQNHGQGGSQTTNQNQGLVTGFDSDYRSILRYSSGLSRGEGKSASWQGSESESQTRGSSHAQSRTRSRSQGSSQGESQTQSQGQTFTRSRSQTQTRSDSLTQGSSESLSEGGSESSTRTQSHSTARSEGAGLSCGRSRGESESTLEGHSHTHSWREVMDYYSVAEETAIRSYELMSLPNRTALVVQRGQGPLQRTRIRTLDMPLEFVTQIGSLDGLADLDRLTRPQSAEPEPGLGVLERLRLQLLELGEGHT